MNSLTIDKKKKTIDADIFKYFFILVYKVK
jgi:hypothetical protein